MITKSALAVTVIALVLVFSISAIYVSHYIPVNGSCTGTGCTSVSSGESTVTMQAGDRTVVATYSPPTPDTTTTISTTLPLYTTGTSQSSGTYTYGHNSQVDIVSVSAVVSQSQYVTFSVQFQNIGSGTIDVNGGGGSALSVEVPSNSAVLTQIQGPRCMIATALIPVGPGQTHTSTSPGCWSGFSYRLVSTGTVPVQMTLSWSSESGTGQSGSLQISAEFNLA